MSKRPSEAAFGAALRAVDLAIEVERLPDPHTGAGVTNWKPCDYLSWHASLAGSTDENEAVLMAASTWWECKDTDAARAFAFADIRPSQIAGIQRAHRVGIPYRLAIFWQRGREWTISDAWRVLQWRDAQIVEARSDNVTSIPRTLLESRFGVSCSPANLSSTLKAVLLGETD